jgi:hypothetical protein
VPGLVLSLSTVVSHLSKFLMCPDITALALPSYYESFSNPFPSVTHPSPTCPSDPHLERIRFESDEPAHIQQTEAMGQVLLTTQTALMSLNGCKQTKKNILWHIKTMWHSDLCPLIQFCWRDHAHSFIAVWSMAASSDNSPLATVLLSLGSLTTT